MGTQMQWKAKKLHEIFYKTW